MQLASYRYDDQDHVGVVQDGHVYPLANETDLDMIAIAAEWPGHRPQAERALAGTAIPLADVRLLPPITRPRKIMAIGMNYADHIQEARDAGHDIVVPETQTWSPRRYRP